MRISPNVRQNIKFCNIPLYIVFESLSNETIKIFVAISHQVSLLYLTLGGLIEEVKLIPFPVAKIDSWHTRQLHIISN